MAPTTHLSKAKIAEIKKNSGKQIVIDIFVNVVYAGRGERALTDAEWTVSRMTTRRMNEWLKANGYTFDETSAQWVTIPESENQS